MQALKRKADKIYCASSQGGIAYSKATARVGRTGPQRMGAGLATGNDQRDFNLFLVRVVVAGRDLVRSVPKRNADEISM